MFSQVHDSLVDSPEKRLPTSCFVLDNEREQSQLTNHDMNQLQFDNEVEKSDFTNNNNLNYVKNAWGCVSEAAEKHLILQLANSHQRCTTELNDKLVKVRLHIYFGHKLLITIIIHFVKESDAY